MSGTREAVVFHMRKNDQTMIHRKQFIIAAFALLVMSVTAYGQANPKAQQRREAIIEAVQAIGLDRDQVAKIREIRRERPPEGTQGQARREWRAGITAKLMEVLNAEQKAKLDEVKAAGADSKAFEGAALLGLAQRPRQN